MGMDVSADIIYGFPVGGEWTPESDEVVPEEGLIEDIEAIYATKMGVDPAEAWKHWRNAPAEIVSAGSLSGGCSTQYLTLRAALIAGTWDGPTILSAEMMQVKPEWEQELRSFCELMGIPWQKPQRMLICSAG